jgi:hypothetical protein
VFFSKLNYVCPAHANPSDYFMRILSVNYPKTENDDKMISAFIEHYRISLMPLILQEATQVQLGAPNEAKMERTRASWGK